MQTARVFQSGNSQAVRLPKAFRFQSDEVEILRRGSEVILREKPRTMKGFVEAILALPDEGLLPLPEDLPPQERDFSPLDEHIASLAAKPRKSRAKRA